MTGVHDFTKQIDVFQERLWDIDTLNIENIGHQMMNYTKKLLVSKNRKEKTNFLWSCMHLPETAPVKIALREAIRPSNKPRGRRRTTYIHVIQTQLKEKHIQTLEDAMIEAKYRKWWRAIVQNPSLTLVCE